MAVKKFSVLIAEDEDYLRIAYKSILNWDDYDCQIIGEAFNGSDALNKISQLNPSIVLLDVNMPEKNGLDVLAEVYNSPEKYPSHPLFIICSEEGNFELAQKAINYGAKGFLVKPLVKDQLEQRIKSLVGELKHHTETLSLRNKVQQEEIIRGYKQMFLFGAVEDAFSSPETDNNRYQVAVISPELCGCAGQPQSLKPVIEESFHFTNHFAFPMEPHYVIVFYNESEEAVSRHLERFCTRLQKNKFGSLASLGNSGFGLEGALNSYNQARTLFNQLFFFSKTPFLTKQIADSDPECQQRLSKISTTLQTKDFLFCISDLIQYIEIYDLHKIDELLEKQYMWLKTSTLPESEIKKLCMAFVVETQNAMNTKHPEKEMDNIPALELVNTIYSQKYFDNLFKIIRDFTKELAESFTSNTNNSTILKVIQYVKTNYNTDLKLEMLGSLFNCNSAYLGKKFREYTGVPFNTYMDIIRIEQAKHMLMNSTLKIYEISKLVGYSNTDYFYLKFKKHTNMTPKEYKLSQNARK